MFRCNLKSLTFFLRICKFIFHSFTFKCFCLFKIISCNLLYSYPRAPEIRVELFHGPKHERERNIRKVIKRGGVTLSTYGIIEKNVDFLEETGCKWVS